MKIEPTIFTYQLTEAVDHSVLYGESDTVFASLVLKSCLMKVICFLNPIAFRKAETILSAIGLT